METERIVYRFFNEEDYETLHGILSNDNFCKYLPARKAMTEKQTKNWHQHFVKSSDTEKPNLIYALIDKENNKLFGYAGVAFLTEFNRCEIMYGIDEAYWGKGYASEAAFKMKEVAISLGLDDVVALADPDNVGSNRILTKIGFEFIKKMELWGMDLNYYEQELK